MSTEQGNPSGGKGIQSGGRWYERPDADQLEADRLALIRQAHDAGIHAPWARGCPWCHVGIRVRPERFLVLSVHDSVFLLCPRPECIRSHVSHRIAVSDGDDWPTLDEAYRRAASHVCNDSPYAALRAGDSESQVQHNGHYGVAGRPFESGDEPIVFPVAAEPGGTGVHDAHKPDYGAPLEDGTGVTGTMIDTVRGPSCPVDGAGDPYAGAIYPGAPVPRAGGKGPCANGCSNPAAHAEGGHDV